MLAMPVLIFEMSRGGAVRADEGAEHAGDEGDGRGWSGTSRRALMPGLKRDESFLIALLTFFRR